jgi:hypothetical protein
MRFIGALRGIAPSSARRVTDGEPCQVEDGTLRLNREIHSAVGDLPPGSEQRKL